MFKKWRTKRLLKKLIKLVNATEFQNKGLLDEEILIRVANLKEPEKGMVPGNFYLVCGISGGGKNIFTQHLLDKNPDKEFVIIDPDEYYAKINGDELIRANFFKVWITIYLDLHDLEVAGKDVIFTSNALTESQRTQFLEWFPSFRHHLLWVISPKEKCFEGNQLRRRHVPNEKLEKQWMRMEFPNPEEKGWDTITHIYNHWDTNYTSNLIKGNIKELIKFDEFLED